jgi:pSer/pThr/pTyr-binding forkhead associated (FHA) protein
MRQHSTTIPSAETDQRFFGDRPTAIRWVSPGRAVMPLGSSWKVVGRDPTCTVTLDGGEISRKHAEFRVDGPIAAIRDLDSRNGSFVNGVRCAEGPIGASDVVRCGE